MHTYRFAFYGLLLAALLATTGWHSEDKPSRLVLQPESKIWIDGTSSMHDWTCEVTELVGAIDIGADAAVPAGVNVSVPVTNLDCDNGTMDDKARKALEAGTHPLIRYQLGSAEVLPEAEAGTLAFKTTGQLTIAGTTRPVEMTITGKQLADGRVQFTGSVPMKMTDFGVKPPSALLGTLKTGDDVTVRFDVVAGPRAQASGK